jgi:hypothetical protein
MVLLILLVSSTMPVPNPNLINTPGIMNAKRQTLIFFDKIPDSDLDEPYVLSSLQDFESAILTFGLGKWSAATTLIFSAIEKLLKRAVGGKGKQIDCCELIDLFAATNPDLTTALKGQAQEYRILRNKLIHGAYSPSIDTECLLMFFGAGLPFFDSILKFQFGGTKEELSGDKTAWFWRVYRDTRKAFSRSDLSDSPRYERLALLQIAAQKIGTGSFGAYQKAYPIMNREGFVFDILQRRDELMWQWEKWFWEEAEKLATTDGSSPACLDDFEDLRCPICNGSDGSLGYREEKAGETWSFGGFTGFCCYSLDCFAGGILISDPMLLQVIFGEKAKPGEIERLLLDDFAPAAKQRWK